MDNRGTLDKYTGDGLVAFWGAPLPISDHADLALDAAHEILLRVRSFSEARAREGKPPLRVRIGIESGEAMAGDFGSAMRSIYTAVGDSVNVASRLEQVARGLSVRHHHWPRHQSLSQAPHLDLIRRSYVTWQRKSDDNLFYARRSQSWQGERMRYRALLFCLTSLFVHTAYAQTEESSANKDLLFRGNASLSRRPQKTMPAACWNK